MATSSHCSALVHSVTPGVVSEDEWTTQDFRNLIPETPIKVWYKLRELNCGFSWISKLALSRSIWSPARPPQVLPKLCGTPARNWRIKGRNATLSYGLSIIIISTYTFGRVIASCNTWPKRKAVFKKKMRFFTLSNVLSTFQTEVDASFSKTGTWKVKN